VKVVGRFHAAWMALRPEFARFGRHLHYGLAAYGVLLVALLLTLLASHYVRQNVQTAERTRFEENTLAAKTVIFRRVNRYLDAMFGARGLLLEDGTVDREGWDTYVKALEPGARYRLNGLQFLGFAKLVRREERGVFSREAQREDVREVWPAPTGESPAYFPLEFVAPFDGANRRMVNYDAYSDPANRSAMDRARDTGSPQATGLVRVLAEASPNTEKDLAWRKGVAVYLPVYQKDEPKGTVAERRDALKGFVVATFTTEELFGEAFSKHFHPAIDFEVYDGGEVESSPLLYDSNGMKNADNKGNTTLFSMERRIKKPLVGREWALFFATLPAFEETKSDLPVFVLASGSTVSLLLFGVTWMLTRSRGHAMRVSADLKEANRELEEANAALQRSRGSLVSAREEERRRLRRDLHDGVGPQLAALMLELETASELVSDNPEASALMTKLSKRAREIVSDVRHSVHALRPPALDELGLLGALGEGAAQYGPAGLRVSVENTGELEHLPAAVEVACYRIVQEAMANVVRHARANHCSVRIRVDEEAGTLSVEVEDDGRGIRREDRSGVGMISMRERTEELGGWCIVKSLEGGGTLLKALLPFGATEGDHRSEV
jgi:signal transduction histidine kinase